MVTNYENVSASHARTMQTEDSFFGGMQYTNAPLKQGYLRNIVNYDISDDGASLKVRPGIKQLEDYIATVPLNDCVDACIFASGRSYVADYHAANTDDYNSYVCEYALLGHVILTDPEVRAYGLDEYVLEIRETSKLFVKYGKDYLAGYLSGDTLTDIRAGKKVYLPLQPCHTTIHGLKLNCNNSRRGIYATHDNNVYLPCYTWDESTHTMVKKLSRIEMMFDAYKNIVTWKVVPIVPRNVTATQAVNYGYNMLLDNPYSFVNSSHSGAAIYMDGIVPYDYNDKLITSCRAGTEITFKLAYRYPAADVTSNKKYRVRWEIQDNQNNNSVSIPLQTARGSANVTPGDAIKYTTRQTSYKSFTLTCKIYDAADVTSDITTDDDELNKLTPLNTMTVSYTYLTAESSATTLNMPAKTYDLSTAKGLCSWQGRLVLWGVKDCESTIWVSEINDPTWFPYPNGIDVFDNDVITCAPYKTTLLVFTESSLNQLTLADDGLSYKHAIIQQNLTLVKEDAPAILTLQNMLFFKNGNYYYMLVPGKVSTNMYGELSLAPISRPLEQLFDNFPQYLLELNCGDTLYDWWCYQERNSFRVCFKVYGSVDGVEKFTDIVFQYNTKSRCWTVYTYQLGKYRCMPWIQSAVEDTKFLGMYAQGDVCTIDVIQPDNTTTFDNTKWFKGCQEGLIDTGYRDINVMLTKKFRSCQMNITNCATQFKFYPELMIDNEIRYNEFVSYEDDGTTYYECNDACTEHDYSSVIPEDRRWFSTDRVCIPFTARGRLPRLILHTTWGEAAERPEIEYLTWIYRNKSGRGGRDGYSPEMYEKTNIQHIKDGNRWGTSNATKLSEEAPRYVGERGM